jgi:opacity protein-like surface antigen
MKNLILSLLIIIIFLSNSSAQQIPDSDTINIKKWSVSINFGVRIGGPNVQLKEAIYEYGFDRTPQATASLFGPVQSGKEKEHPYTNTYPSLMINAKYYITGPLAIGISTGYTHLGDIHGYNTGYLNINNSVFSISPIISLNSYDIVRIGLGPALFFTNAFTGNLLDPGEEKYRHKKIGFVIAFGFRIPKTTRVFFEFDFQYRYVGKADIGPFTVDNYQSATLPKTSVSYNHAFIGAGFGFRF